MQCTLLPVDVAGRAPPPPGCQLRGETQGLRRTEIETLRDTEIETLGCKARHQQALNEAKVSMSPVQTTFVVASAASAASGKSDGTERKRQIKPVQVPVEKEACGVVPQPVLTPEELKKICLSSARLEQWCHMPFFATTVTGCFLRVSMEDGSGEPGHCITEIVSVMETDQVYQLKSKRTNLGFQLRHAGIDQIVTLKSASDKEFTIGEFMFWELAMSVAGMQVPTLNEIARKAKSLKEALDHTLTPKELNLLVAQKNRFRAPIRAPPPKAQTDYEQARNPCVQRKTRPFMVMSFKNSSARKAIMDELDRRYGCGSTEEEK
ncbi:unnamed protein product [Pleuronectes platessa]|uniref:Plus3 domain-containing protein n=1 Tax=Pleuronectes platessa TaxID=8262 RepID=A0A9N7W0J8_PLEPL|nr:unnamed protein product [Pleuronectes platessa]